MGSKNSKNQYDAMEKISTICELMQLCNNRFVWRCFVKTDGMIVLPIKILISFNTAINSRHNFCDAVDKIVLSMFCGECEIFSVPLSLCMQLTNIPMYGLQCKCDIPTDIIIEPFYKFIDSNTDDDISFRVSDVTDNNNIKNIHIEYVRYSSRKPGNTVIINPMRFSNTIVTAFGRQNDYIFEFALSTRNKMMCKGFIIEGCLLSDIVRIECHLGFSNDVVHKTETIYKVSGDVCYCQFVTNPKYLYKIQTGITLYDITPKPYKTSITSGIIYITTNHILARPIRVHFICANAVMYSRSTLKMATFSEIQNIIRDYEG